MKTIQGLLRSLSAREFPAKEARAYADQEFENADHSPYDPTSSAYAAGLSNGIYMGAKFQHTQDQKIIVKLVAAVKMALYYVEGDATAEGVEQRILEILGSET